MNRSRSGRRKTTGSQILFRYVLVLLVIATLVAGWLFYRTYFGSDKAAAPKAKPAPSQNLDATEHMPQTEPETEVPAPETTAAETEPQVMTVTMMAVGDNLIHNTVYRSGWGTDPWNYDHLYAHVKDDIESADIAVINQETIFVSDHANVSNYPAFGTPREIGDAVYKAGFDVILHASNHAMDKGIQNIYDAIDYWSDKDVTVLGIHKSAADAAVPTIVEKNGIKIGMINYTYGLNGFVLPAGNEFAVDLLDYRDKLLSDIEYLEENADITVAFLHMGIEYMVTPSAASKEMVELVVSHGVDLCINAHPHVVEPCVDYVAKNGNKAVVYYSLGNFISAQNRLDSLLGGMAKLTIQKTVQNGTSVTEVTEHELLPIVTHSAYGTAYSVYHLEDYNDTLGSQHIMHRMTTKELWNRWHEIVGDEE